MKKKENNQNGTLDFSIVIPVYNEQNRLPNTLDLYIKLLSEKSDLSYEIIIVDDGSADNTVSVVRERMLKDKNIVLLEHKPNRGRGFSVREGVLNARGKIILETDSDGSVDHEAIFRFYNYLCLNDVDAIFGSRMMKGASINKEQPFIRVFLGNCFIFLSKAVFGLWKVTDFTLGFKMFKKKCSDDVFIHQYDNRYVAEAEIVVVSNVRGWKVIEMPVFWSDNKDSRVKVVRDSLRSLNGVIMILWRWVMGFYK